MEPDGPSKKENHKESCQAANALNTRSVSSVVTRGPSVLLQSQNGGC